jgi:hypothetical protein
MTLPTEEIKIEFDINLVLSAVFRGAYALILKEGWCQHDFRDLDGRFSIGGACIASAIHIKRQWGINLLSEGIGPVIDVLCYWGLGGAYSPETWNDHLDRTKQDVLRVLAHTSDKLRLASLESLSPSLLDEFAEITSSEPF